ncbi:retinol-binding protein 1 isoform X1 [Onychostruthus taczanowskii]|uniref:retinol-binding protein 1 isoform X1 n=1 Tax=Onychostruthus taczanowskii TaxID=356909 RepID=UPI001B80828E|nr:retinol-binding protein 1 isoform X1 [Onychostruthus taczanowskii]
MPADFNGYWKMVSNDNFEEYLKALDVNVAVRKIANLLKPDKEILQNGDHMIIKTLSTFRNYIMEFDVGKEFEEDLSGVDDRKCMVRSRTSALDKMNIDNLRLFTERLLTIQVAIPEIISILLSLPRESRRGPSQALSEWTLVSSVCASVRRSSFLFPALSHPACTLGMSPCLPLCLGMEISCFVYRMERRKAVVGPSGLKEMKCTWK